MYQINLFSKAELECTSLRQLSTDIFVEIEEKLSLNCFHYFLLSGSMDTATCSHRSSQMYGNKFGHHNNGSLHLILGPCLKGYQMNERTLACELCPVGFYQVSDYQFQCTQCPPEKAYTSEPGSMSFSDCKSKSYFLMKQINLVFLLLYSQNRDICQLNSHDIPVPKFIDSIGKG